MAVKIASKIPSRPAISSLCSSCRHRLLRQQTRLASTDTLSSTTKNSQSPSSPDPPRRPLPSASIFQQVSAKTAARGDSPFGRNPTSPSRPTSGYTQSSIQDLLSSANAEASTRPGSLTAPDEPYHIHVMATKHNTHITFSEPSRSPILSFSCGSLGLRKAQRGTFDAAYQLATYTMRKMAMHQWRVGGKKLNRNQMKTLRDVGTKDTGVGIEVVLRGFGAGREAFQKALLGTEGSMIKPMIVRVSDATRLKFGGCRSPAVRRL